MHTTLRIHKYLFQLVIKLFIPVFNGGGRTQSCDRKFTQTMWNSVLFFTVLGCTTSVLARVHQESKPYAKPWKPQHIDSKIPQCSDNNGPLILTPYIKSGDIQKAQELSRVQLCTLTIPSHSGYFTVNETDNSNMFFWFFPAEVPQPEKAPVVLWLQGGPGASSLFGLFVENGPFKIANSMKLTTRVERWTKLANMIYIDNPVGTGFSFTGSNDGYSRNEDQVGRNLYEALLQFYTMFPQYQNGEFYASGESYGGKYVPAIGHRIHVEHPGAALKIPLKGVTIGNGWVDPGNMAHYGDLLFQLGMLDEMQRDHFRQEEDKYRQALSEQRWLDANAVLDALIEGNEPTYFYNATHNQFVYNILFTTAPPDMRSCWVDYVQKCFVRAAIHVGNQEFSDGTLVGNFLVEDVGQSTASWLAEMMDNYRVMVYNGQLDIICGLPLTESYLRVLPWSGADGYKKARKIIWKANQNDTEVAGYLREVGNFTQVAVRLAGHMAPHDQPRTAFDMIRRFFTGESFKS